MPDCQQQIASWRRSLAEKIGPDQSTLDELECHLRDEMDRLVGQGQAPDEAVRAAIAKIGTPEKLAMEFAKVARPWWPIRVVLACTFIAIAGLLVLFGIETAGGRWDGLLVAHVAAITVGYVLTCGIGALALCFALRRMVQDLPIGQKTSWLRALTRVTVVAFALTLTGTVLGALWANRQWGRYWSWDVKETGALATMIWQVILLGLLWRGQARIRWLVCWGMLGDVFVTFAWFVTNVLDVPGQVHGYGHPPILTVFYTILVTHVLLIAGVLAPCGWLRMRKNAG